jgi:hypothetical protein
VRRRTFPIVVFALALLPLSSIGGSAGAQAVAPPRPGPGDEARAAEAGRQAGAPQGPALAAATVGPQQYVSARVFATQYYPNTPGSVEVAVPDKCAKFAALGNTGALSQANCPAGYRLGLDYRVQVTRDSGQSAALPVKDVGPWNTDDNYWDFGPGAPRPRRLFGDLPPGLPEAQAAVYNGYNVSSNCLTLGRQPSGHPGGADQFGRCVLNPAGLDLSVAAAAQLGLGNLQNEWVTVTFLWEPVRNNIVSVNSGKFADVDAWQLSDGAAIIQWTGHGGANQQWRFEYVGPNAWRIVSVHSGKVLDVAGGSLADGAPVIQWTWHGGPNQQWRVEPVDETAVRIVSVKSGKVLDVPGGSTADGPQLIQWTWHGGNNQRWRLVVMGSG